ncbi:Superfamily II DNA or RNA helicase, SNF2 family [Novosphingobium sp. CF614]|nr:Superfamily II DNA or RNA helicase, SNF2 family [Novosphingobium sp. CF614]
MLEAGRVYFRQGRVTELMVERDMGVVGAMVRGSGRNSYFTSVIFEDEEYGSFPSSQCSCPVGDSCKHVAALLFALRGALPDRRPPSPAARSGLRIEAKAQPAPTLSGPVGTWLEAVTLDALSARARHDPLCFVIEPARAFKPAKTGKKAAQAGEKVPDRFIPKVRAWRLRAGEQSWRPAYQWELSHAAGYLDPRATRLLARTAPAAFGGDFGPDGAPRGAHGWQWLREAAEAGLLRWKSPDGPLVTTHDTAVEARLSWSLFEDGRQIIGLAAIDPAMPVFAGDPPMVFDPDRAELDLIETGLPPSLAGRLLAMPPVGPAEAPALAARWAEIAGDALAPPRLPVIEQIASIPPRPVLRFLIDRVQRPVPNLGWGSRSRVQATELVRLEFDYAGHRIRASASAREVIAVTKAGMTRVIRDLKAEQAAVDRLAQTSLLPIALLKGFDPKSHQGWDHMLPDPGRDDDPSGGFAEFLINEVETLQAEGWLVEYARDWRYGYVPLDSDETRLALVPDEGKQAKTRRAKDKTGEIDWFDVELAALVDGQRIDILPALRRLLAENGSALLDHDDDHRMPVMLGNGRFTAMRLGTVRPLAEALLRLALADRSAATLRLNRYDMGTVHELAGSGLGWASKDSLRTLAAALHGPDGGAYAKPAGLVAELRPYQQVGAAWLRALHEAGLGGILADDMGLGKTLQAIAHILAVRRHAAKRDSPSPLEPPVLIIAPTSVLPNWQAELARFAPGVECLLWHGTQRREAIDDLRRAEVVLTSYPLLARDQELLAEREHALVVLDEAHVLKNPKTAGFKAAAALKAQQVIALSGTPIENRLNDVWALASLTNPGLLGSFEGFRKAYRTPIEKHNDSAAQAALARRLRPFMLRRTKDQVAADLPPKTLIPERIELSDQQIRLYESQRLLMQKRVREEIDRVGLMRSQIIVLDAMLKLRQICCDPALLPGGLGEGTASAKRARLLEMLGELIEEGRKVIVFSQFTTMLDLIAADLDHADIAYEQLRGTTRDRARPVRRFQQGEVPLILVSLKAGGAGVNLTAADTVILYDPWWNPAVEAQAIDRAHRIGQDKPVFVHRLIATGTIEEKILALQERKQNLADMLWDDHVQAGGPSLSDEDIAFLLG